MKKNDAFSIVELLVTVSIIGILAAIAMPMYAKYTFRANMVDILNQAEPIMLQMEDYISANTDTQEGLDNLDVKNTYFGTEDQEFMIISGYSNDSDFIAANPDYVSNNGRVIYSRNIGSTTYDIALTPRITNKTLKWDCVIYDQTNGKYPDSDLLPSTCNVGDVENDDQLNYDFNYLNLNGEDGTGGTALKDGYDAAEDAWHARTENALAADSAYQSYVTAKDNAYDAYKNCAETYAGEGQTYNWHASQCDGYESTYDSAVLTQSSRYNYINNQQKDNTDGTGLTDSSLAGSFTDDMIETYQEYL